MNFIDLLDSEIRQYLIFRRQLGYKALDVHYQLRLFSRYCALEGITSFSDVNLQTIETMKHKYFSKKSPGTVNGHFSIVKYFYNYLMRKEIVASNPLVDLPALRINFFTPFVFTPEQVQKILNSFLEDITASTQWTYYVPRYSHYVAFTIQAHCGLRVSEVCNLKVSDIDFTERTIFIRQTKFSKDRLIPISDYLLNIINNFLIVRNHVTEDTESPYLLKAFGGVKYSRKTLGFAFTKKMKEMGLFKSKEIIGDVVFGCPNSHSLRHSFAVNMIRRWQSQGLPIDRIADTLATYMGHVSINYTQVYLKNLSTKPTPLTFKRNDKV